MKEKVPLSFESKVDENKRRQKVLITVPGENLPIDSFVVKTTETDFDRPVILYASNDKDALIYNSGERYDSEKNY